MLALGGGDNMYRKVQVKCILLRSAQFLMGGKKRQVWGGRLAGAGRWSSCQSWSVSWVFTVAPPPYCLVEIRLCPFVPSVINLFWDRWPCISCWVDTTKTGKEESAGHPMWFLIRVGIELKLRKENIRANVVVLEIGQSMWNLHCGFTLL